MTGSVLSSGQAAAILFGCFFSGLFLRIPVAFALRNLSLVLGVLTAVLVGMLAGLSVVGLALQPPLEAALLRALTALGCDAFLYAVAVKNLSGHRTRNTQTAAMVGLAAAFLIFASAMFTLQVRAVHAVRDPAHSLNSPVRS
jgi:hypothetical protein